MTKQNLKARENSINLPPNLKFSGFRQTTKRKQRVFHTRLLLQSKLFWITILYFAINICFKIHLFRTKTECLPTIIPSFCYFCRHPVLHRADTPHVWLYTVIYMKWFPLHFSAGVLSLQAVLNAVFPKVRRTTWHIR